MNIAFLHPDLGIGGAERLVVDAALALQGRGHRVTIFTSHHDPARCFDETRDGTLDVKVFGDFLPSHTADRLRAPAAIARMCYLVLRVRALGERFDAYFCDLLAHPLPLLRMLDDAPVVFYCHFPDRLLAPQRRGLYRAYRWPIDRWEERAMAKATKVLVNSEFTARVVAGVLPSVRDVEVVYPGVTVPAAMPPSTSARNADAVFTLLCVSRFDASKNLPLALDAFVALRERLPAETFARTRLVFAGGYDPRLRGSRELLADLEARAERAHVAGQVRFVRSPSDAEREQLLRDCGSVLFTAHNEHFGYVPVEAMAAGKPVVAVASGGPLETVRDGETGFLCAAEPHALAQRIESLVRDPQLCSRLGARGRTHVEAAFSQQAFGRRLGTIFESLRDARKN
jgi:glycosyltransferase involved in cell wall biosynthesis